MYCCDFKAKKGSCMCKVYMGLQKGSKQKKTPFMVKGVFLIL